MMQFNLRQAAASLTGACIFFALARGYPQPVEMVAYSFALLTLFVDVLMFYAFIDARERGALPYVAATVLLLICLMVLIPGAALRGWPLFWRGLVGMTTIASWMTLLELWKSPDVARR